MSLVIDFHAHVFEDKISHWIPKVSKGVVSQIVSTERIQEVKKKARGWVRPITSAFHNVQTNLRYLPDTARKNLDQLTALVPLPNLLLESTPTDLKEAMDEGGIDSTVVIAHPPFISNEFTLRLCEEEPRFIPVVNIPKGTLKPGQVFKRMVDRGAKALKIHAAADGEGADCPRYRSLIRAASDLGKPIILHTGCLHSSLMYRNPEQGQAEKYTKWYENYPDTQFILAHMNFHDPYTALDLCEEFPNLWVDTSWQPTEIIGEAVRRIGADRVLFGTDWPFLGSNMMIGRKRIEEGVESGLLNQEQAKLILGENAEKLLGIS